MKIIINKKIQVQINKIYQQYQKIQYKKKMIMIAKLKILV